MKVHTVTVNSGWILQKIAERFCVALNKLGHSSSVSTVPSEQAELNVYFDLQNCYRGYRNLADIALFTHADMNSKEWLAHLLRDRHANRLTGIFSMNQRYTNMLEEVGFPAERLTTITPGDVTAFKLKKIKIGIVSRGGFPGYGTDFIKDLFKQAPLDNFSFHILGKGWDSLQSVAAVARVDLTINSDESYEHYEKFYESIDYLLIPGLWTAGPMSFMEALAKGLPVISADVGFNGYEFHADYTFPAGDVDALTHIMIALAEPLIQRRRQVLQYSWVGFAKQVISFSKRLKTFQGY